MRLRPKRCLYATVTASDNPKLPIALVLGPALGFEMTPDEARELALALVDAIEQSSTRPSAQGVG
ncbi:MAG: hypothetical protein QOH91_1617 [Mycobacterium sp.]|jgi:hypothetical protein|nr:hypothetical protein [Mycobacterium sp.]